MPLSKLVVIAILLAAAPAQAGDWWSMRYGAAVQADMHAREAGIELNQPQAIYQGGADLLRLGREEAALSPVGRYLVSPFISPMIEFSAGYPERMQSLALQTAGLGIGGIAFVAALPTMATYPLATTAVGGGLSIYGAGSSRQRILGEVEQLNSEMLLRPFLAQREANMLALDGGLEMGTNAGLELLGAIPLLRTGLRRMEIPNWAKLPSVRRTPQIAAVDLSDTILERAIAFHNTETIEPNTFSALKPCDGRFGPGIIWDNPVSSTSGFAIVDPETGHFLDAWGAEFGDVKFTDMPPIGTCLPSGGLPIGLTTLFQLKKGHSLLNTQYITYALVPANAPANLNLGVDFIIRADNLDDLNLLERLLRGEGWPK